MIVHYYKLRFGGLGGGVVSAVHVWNPDDWESFALNLLQSRHGALNVHKIPAAHKGDLGVDFYCTNEAVAYQCYVAQEPIDIATRADRQKKKITTDVKKIVDRSTDISKLFLGQKVKHWILLTPIHDSKEVNLHCSYKTVEVRKKKCAHLDDAFEVGVHDQKSFAASAVVSGMMALATLSLSVGIPTSEEMSAWEAGSADLLANATHKLLKRTGSEGVAAAVTDAVQLFLRGNALLEALRSSAPDLHERITAAVAARSRVLNFTGPQGGPAPGAILNTELMALVAAIKSAAPNLSDANAEEVALGTLSEWIMRCPMDFPSHAA